MKPVRFSNYALAAGAVEHAHATGAIRQQAKRFYLHHGFGESAIDSLVLMLRTTPPSCGSGAPAGFMPFQGTRHDGLNQRFPKLSQGFMRAYQSYLNMSVLT